MMSDAPAPGLSKAKHRFSLARSFVRVGLLAILLAMTIWTLPGLFFLAGIGEIQTHPTNLEQTGLLSSEVELRSAISILRELAAPGVLSIQGMAFSCEQIEVSDESRFACMNFLAPFATLSTEITKSGSSSPSNLSLSSFAIFAQRVDNRSSGCKVYGGTVAESLAWSLYADDSHPSLVREELRFIFEDDGAVHSLTPLNQRLSVPQLPFKTSEQADFLFAHRKDPSKEDSVLGLSVKSTESISDDWRRGGWRLVSFDPQFGCYEIEQGSVFWTVWLMDYENGGYVFLKRNNVTPTELSASPLPSASTSSSIASVEEL